MKKRSRAYRINQSKRCKRRVLSYFVSDVPDANPRYIGRVSRTPKPCSCYMCGNPRRWWQERTRQEIQSALDCREAMRDAQEER